MERDLEKSAVLLARIEGTDVADARTKLEGHPLMQLPADLADAVTAMLDEARVDRPEFDAELPEDDEDGHGWWDLDGDVGWRAWEEAAVPFAARLAELTGRNIRFADGNVPLTGEAGSDIIVDDGGYVNIGSLEGFFGFEVFHEPTDTNTLAAVNGGLGGYDTQVEWLMLTASARLGVFGTTSYLAALFALEPRNDYLHLPFAFVGEVQ